MKNLLLLTAVVLFVGCKKETLAKPGMVIEILTPTANQHFVMGQTIHIKGKITSSKALTEVAVHMTDLDTKIEFFHNHFSGGNQMEYQFDSSYPIPDNKKATIKAEVEATDEDGNSTSKEVTITFN